MSAKMDKSFARIVEELKRQGWTVRTTRNSHLMCKSPTGQIVVGSGTTDGKRALANFRADLRRAGANL